MPAAELLREVGAIAAAAGRLALGRWRGDVGARRKEDGTPVCDVDLAVDAFLHERLHSLLPDAGWLSEETADVPDRLARARVWVVDPIDGTRDYIRGRDGWCVSVALVEDGCATLGVLDAPARGNRWSAAVGAGAWRGHTRLQVADRAELAGARIPSDTLAKVDRLFACVEKPNSIALRIAKVAAAEADLVATLRWGHEWDVAAAVLIAAEAGAAVGDAFGQPLRFNKPEPSDFGVLVCSPALQNAAVAHLQSRATALSRG